MSYEEQAQRTNVLLEQLFSQYHVFGEKLDSIDHRVERLEQKVDRLEQKVDRLEQKVDRLEQKVDRLDMRVGVLEQKMDIVIVRLDRIEDHIGLKGTPSSSRPAIRKRRPTKKN